MVQNKSSYRISRVARPRADWETAGECRDSCSIKQPQLQKPRLPALKFQNRQEAPRKMAEKENSESLRRQIEELRAEATRLLSESENTKRKTEKLAEPNESSSRDLITISIFRPHGSHPPRNGHPSSAKPKHRAEKQTD
jgi:hypothetical protein